MRRVRNTWQTFALLLLLALIFSRCAWVEDALRTYGPVAPAIEAGPPTQR